MPVDEAFSPERRSSPPTEQAVALPRLFWWVRVCTTTINSTDAVALARFRPRPGRPAPCLPRRSCRCDGALLRASCNARRRGAARWRAMHCCLVWTLGQRVTRLAARLLHREQTRDELSSQLRRSAENAPSRAAPTAEQQREPQTTSARRGPPRPPLLRTAACPQPTRPTRSPHSRLSLACAGATTTTTLPACPSASFACIAIQTRLRAMASAASRVNSHKSTRRDRHEGVLQPEIASKEEETRDRANNSSS